MLASPEHLIQKGNQQIFVWLAAKYLLKAKSTKGSMYFPVTGGLFFGIAKDKSLFLIHRYSEDSPRRDKK
jgi:hypothetical protein